VNGVVDTTTPHDSLRDRSKVVVHEGGVGGLFDGLSTGSAHRGPGIGGFECGTAVCAVARSVGDLAKTWSRGVTSIRSCGSRAWNTGPSVMMPPAV